MKIDITSDLHLIHESQIDEFQFGSGDVLIVAGDLVNHFYDFETLGKKFLLRAKLIYDNVIYVLGNHEYYDLIRSMYEIEGSITEWASNEDIIILGIGGVVGCKINNVQFYGSTFWSNLDDTPANIDYIEHCINDFNYISKKPFERITTQDVMNFNRMSRNDLNSLKNIDVVITHFPPSKKSIHEKYEGNRANSYFSNSNLDKWIEQSDVKLWLHGHTHSSFDYNIGKTRVVCNPLGFIGENDTKGVKEINLDL